MRKALFLGAALALATPCAPVAAVTAISQQAPAAVADDLLGADRAFASAAANRPAADAIAAMLADDVALFIVPVGTLARGRAQAIEVLAQAFAGEPSTLRWAPVRAGVSADGTQGFTYGFIDRTVAGKPPALGKYVAYWVRRPEGWRVAAFKLVPRPTGTVATALRPAALPGRMVPVATDPALIARYGSEVDRVERQFSDDAQVTSLGAAFRKYGSADAMNVGGGADFTYGNDAIAEAQGGDAPAPSSLRWAPDGVIVASSGDLGITYGYLERNGPTPPGRLARIPWITVWRRASPQDPWRYVAE